MGIRLGVEGRSLREAAVTGAPLLFMLLLLLLLLPPLIISATSSLSPSRSSAGLWERRERGSERLTLLDSSLSLLLLEEEEAQDGDLTPRPAACCCCCCCRLTPPDSQFSGAEPESDSSPLYTKEEFLTRRPDGVSSAESAVLTMVVVWTRGLGAPAHSPNDVGVLGLPTLAPPPPSLVGVLGLAASLFRPAAVEALGPLE